MRMRIGRTRRTTAWVLSALVLLLLLVPLANAIMIRSIVAGHEDSEGLRNQEGVAINSAFLGALKWQRFQELAAEDTERMVVWLGSSSNLVYSQDLLSESLACGLRGRFFNFAIHNTDILALTRLIPRLSKHLGPDDLIVIGTYPQIFTKGMANHNYDIYAPWLSPWQVAKTSFGNNRGRLVPRILERRETNLSIRYYTSLVEFFKFGARANADEIWATDGSTRFIGERGVLSAIEKGTHHPPDEVGQKRIYFDREWNSDAVAVLKRLFIDLPQDVMFVEFQPWRGGASTSYLDLIERNFPNVPHLVPDVPRDFALYFDEVHYLDRGAKQAIKSVRAELSALLCEI